MKLKFAKAKGEAFGEKVSDSATRVPRTGAYCGPDLILVDA